MDQKEVVNQKTPPILAGCDSKQTDQLFDIARAVTGIAIQDLQRKTHTLCLSQAFGDKKQNPGFAQYPGFAQFTYPTTLELDVDTWQQMMFGRSDEFQHNHKSKVTFKQFLELYDNCETVANHPQIRQMRLVDGSTTMILYDVASS